MAAVAADAALIPTMNRLPRRLPAVVAPVAAVAVAVVDPIHLKKAVLRDGFFFWLGLERLLQGLFVDLADLAPVDD